ncbi:MAG: deoxyribodipyrimidine photolyase [Planctomycetaceae bacterium]
MTGTPTVRIRALNGHPPSRNGGTVLYWMTSARRASHNFALDRALEIGRELRRPVVVLEALACDYPWASDRLHRFVLDGMADNAIAFARAKVTYYPYVEPRPRAGKGLVRALARQACAVVTDDTPVGFLRRMIEAAARQVRVAMEAVDSNGLLPLAVSERAHPSAYAFRRFLQKSLAPHLASFPSARPFRAAAPAPPDLLPAAVRRRWPPAEARALRDGARMVAALPIDHEVSAVPVVGGARAGRAALRAFVGQRLARYAQDRAEPELEATSGLSPYLHFGHLSIHEIFSSIAAAEGWAPHALSPQARGTRTGWWGMGASAEAFLDQAVTWRELGFHFCVHRKDADRYASLPAWARRTLATHARDPRDFLYTRREFEEARTHDPLWNAAQRQLLREGRIANSLRMLWGKKILAWSRSPRAALASMLALNDRWALEGRDPNSLSGIFWILGRFDRPWGPERPVFGKIRFMSSANAARKYSLRGYLEKYGT